MSPFENFDNATDAIAADCINSHEQRVGTTANAADDDGQTRPEAPIKK